MRLRVVFSSFCFASLCVLPLVAQIPDIASRVDAIRGGSTISGVLYGPQGAPWNGGQIELRDVSTMQLVQTTYSQGGGNFELRNLPPGNYELTAEMQGLRGRQFVSTGSPLVTVEVHLESGFKDHAAPGPATSVAMLKVPQKARERCTKAEQALAASKFDQSRKLVDESLSMYSKNPRALTLRGILEIQANDSTAAMQDLQSAIDIDPNYDAPYTALSSIYNGQGRFEDAARTTERAVAIAPNSWQGYFEMARAYVGKGMYQKGLDIANRAQALGANSIPSLHLVKAYAMVPLKLYKDASQELQAFLSHAPEGPSTESVKRLLAQVQAAEAASAAPATGLAFAPQH